MVVGDDVNQVFAVINEAGAKQPVKLATSLNDGNGRWAARSCFFNIIQPTTSLDRFRCA